MQQFISKSTKHPFILSTILAIGLSSITVQLVHSQTLQRTIRNSEAQTAVGGTNSGSQGSNKILRRRPSEGRALVGLVLSERNDDPCELTTNYRGLRNNSPFAGTGAFQRCSNNNGGSTQSRRTIQLPVGYFTTGVRVCMNSSQTKIKGVQLIGTRLDCLTFNVPQLQSDLGCLAFRHFERQNCQGSNSGIPDADWTAAAGCPLSTVAIGVQLSTRSSGGNRRMIDGIGLKCVRVNQ